MSTTESLNAALRGRYEIEREAGAGGTTLIECPIPIPLTMLVTHNILGGLHWSSAGEGR